MNDTITIPTDRLQVGIVQFVESSALAHCTTTERHTNGTVTVTSSWPVAGFSSGEVVAWSLLRSLVSGELRRMFERLDTDTISALIGSLATMRQEVAA